MINKLVAFWRWKESGELSGTDVDKLLRLVDKERLPGHIAIIMDGNGRWAQKRGLPRSLGHRAGVESLRDVVKICS